MSKKKIFIMHGKINKIIFFMKTHKIVFKLFVAIIWIWIKDSNILYPHFGHWLNEFLIY
jgi:hypothetical protein